MPAATLVPGLSGSFRYTVGPDRTVPAIYPDAADFQLMPPVFATGYMVALCEWAAIALIKPHLDWPNEQSLGTHVNLSHVAATPVGMTVTVAVKLVTLEQRRLVFEIEARDPIDVIATGTHERHLIMRDRFLTKITQKADAFAAKRGAV
jgi:fluoroacetyl-CoA thioesterase